MLNQRCVDVSLFSGSVFIGTLRCNTERTHVIRKWRYSRVILFYKRLSDLNSVLISTIENSVKPRKYNHTDYIVLGLTENV